MVRLVRDTARAGTALVDMSISKDHLDLSLQTYFHDTQGMHYGSS